MPDLLLSSSSSMSVVIPFSWDLWISVLCVFDFRFAYFFFHQAAVLFFSHASLFLFHFLLAFLLLFFS